MPFSHTHTYTHVHTCTDWHRQTVYDMHIINAGVNFGFSHPLSISLPLLILSLYIYIYIYIYTYISLSLSRSLSVSLANCVLRFDISPAGSWGLIKAAVGLGKLLFTFCRLFLCRWHHTIGAPRRPSCPCSSPGGSFNR